MSRRSRNRTSSTGRGTTDPAKRTLAPVGTFAPGPVAAPLRELEDRSSFWPSTSPMDWEPARRLTGSPARLSLPTPSPSPVRGSVRVFGPSVVAFERPRGVAVCVRRAIRREVLHAMKKTGRGHRKQRAPRRNAYSSVSCR